MDTYLTRFKEAQNIVTATSINKTQDALTRAENASNTANNASSTANSKAQVFYSPNNPPNNPKENDLWVDGVNIKRWNKSQWVLVSEYDGTQTVINKGLVSTGALIVGTNTVKGNGGIAGGGTIRIWAGGPLSAGLNVAPSDSPFRVYDTGAVISRSSFKVEDANKNVNAGFQSDGSSASSIRLWVGNTTPSSAPFRVTHDGSMYATKGKLGGFEISNRWLRSDNDSGYIEMKGASTHIAFGTDLIPSVVGGAFTCTGMIHNMNGNSNTDQTIGLHIKAGGAAKYAVAADLDGGLKVRGGISFVEDIPDVGDSQTITSQDLAFRRTFVFQPTYYWRVTLPTTSEISNLFGYNSKGYAASWQSVIKITIIISRYATDSVNIQCATPILDNNGNHRKDNNSVAVSNFNMSKGDCCELAYFNGAWYTLSLSK